MLFSKMAEQASAKPAESPKLQVDKFAEGDVVCLRFSGVLDEDFDRQAMPTSNRPATVLHLGHVERISSFGIREWVDYIEQLGKRTRKIVLVECSPKVMDQINMVANFAGTGVVYSFKAPFHCDYCEHDEDMLVRVDEEWEAIQRRKLQRMCSECGQPTTFDGDPVTYLASLVTQGRPEIDPEIEAFVAKISETVSPGSRRIHVEKVIEGRFVFLRMVGDLGARWPRGLAESAEGTVIFDVGGISSIDQDGLDQWRQLIETIKPEVDGIILNQVPPMFLVKLLRREDLGQRMQVLSIVVPYRCEKCGAAAAHILDVEREFDLLHQCQPPDRKCPDCHGSAVCIATDDYRIRWKDMPRPTRASEPRKLIKKIERQKHADSRIKATELEPRRQFRLFIILAVLAALAATATVILYLKLGARQEEELKGFRLLNASAETRPDWVPEDGLGLASCKETGDGGLSCVGVSSHWRVREEARSEARDAALEAMATAIGDLIQDETWSSVVRPAYTEARASRLASLDNARASRPEDSRFETPRKVRISRKRVAKLLEETGSGLLPRDTSQEYWEELELGRSGRLYVVAARYDLDSTQFNGLKERYASAEVVEGVTAVTLFPSLLWRYPEIDAGAFSIQVADGRLTQAGVVPGMAIIEVEGRRVRSASDLARVVKEELEYLLDRGGVLTLQVTEVDGSLLTGLDLKIEAVEKKVGHRRRHPPKDKDTGPSLGDTWSSQGGNVGTGRDNPLE